MEIDTEGALPVQWVFIAEVIDEDDETNFQMLTSDSLRKWQLLGLIEWAKNNLLADDVAYALDEESN